jgi:ABC-2 type transport system permease protein
MSTLAIARKDFRDAIQSWTFIGVTAVFILLLGGGATLIAFSSVFLPGNVSSSEALISNLSGIATVFIPIIGLMMGYKSISGERETGTLNLLLSFPYTRSEVVIGKLIGRTGIVSVGAIVGFLIAAGIVVALAMPLSIGSYVTFVVLALVLGLVFVSIGIALSAATRSSTRALVGAIVLFALFFHFGPFSLWWLIPVFIVLLLNRFTPLNMELGLSDLQLPEWLQYYAQFNPVNAYFDTYQVLIADTPVAQELIAPDVPDTFGFVVFALWIIVPLVLGYYRFNTTDL